MLICSGGLAAVHFECFCPYFGVREFVMAHDLPLNQVLGPDLGGEDEVMSPRLSRLHFLAHSVMVIICQGHTRLKQYCANNR